MTVSNHKERGNVKETTTIDTLFKRTLREEPEKRKEKEKGEKTTLFI